MKRNNDAIKELYNHLQECTGVDSAKVRAAVRAWLLRPSTAPSALLYSVPDKVSEVEIFYFVVKDLKALSYILDGEKVSSLVMEKTPVNVFNV